MTIQGTVNRTAFLLLITILSASWVWGRFFKAGELVGLAEGFAVVRPWVIGGAIGGLVFCLITVFKKEWSRVTACIYAACEGLFLGGISAVLEAQFGGIVIQAVALTLGVLLCLLVAYKTRIIKATENFKLGVMAATGAIFLLYMVTWILSMFGVQAMGFIHSSGPLGIGISVVIVIIAALNLVLDFDFIENGAARGAPKYMEWYAAFGLLVTLVWLYLEILRLLAKLRND